MSSRIQQFHIKRGVRAYLRGGVVIIQSVTGLDSVIVRAVENGKTEEVKIRELVPAEITLEVDPKAVSENKRSKEALEKLNEVAQQKVEIIKPLLNMAKRTRKAVEERAAEFGRGASTLYEWIAEYGQEREIENLYSKLRSDAGTNRIPSATEEISCTSL
jgi:putative transposase